MDRSYPVSPRPTGQVLGLLQLLADGRSLDWIARHQRWSVRTLKERLHGFQVATGATNVASSVAVAILSGWICRSPAADAVLREQLMGVDPQAGRRAIETSRRYDRAARARVLHAAAEPLTA